MYINVQRLRTEMQIGMAYRPVPPVAYRPVPPVPELRRHMLESL